ncbi:hypothetical protein GGF42_004595 [Coemansia sp. RSA 2424]|nr:hypothetical protein GGF42_004595 [Coemansia sp. RSA 2424]
MARTEVDTPSGENQAVGGGGPQEPTAESTSLYEDKYLLVTKEGITIHRYYFPLMGDKFIRWEEIEYVKTAQELGVKWYAIKEWGTSISNIWWNCAWRFIKNPTRDGWGFNGMDYILRTNIVIKVKDSNIRPGSYVDRPDEAMAAISDVLQRQGGHSHAE